MIRPEPIHDDFTTKDTEKSRRARSYSVFIYMLMITVISLGMKFEKISHQVIGAAIEVHKELGPGLLESSYQKCLEHELHLRGVPYKAQHRLPVIYKGLVLEVGYQMDILAAEELVVELKSVEQILPVHDAQILTYMKLSTKSAGLLLNFNVAKMKDGIKRFVL